MDDCWSMLLPFLHSPLFIFLMGFFIVLYIGVFFGGSELNSTKLDPGLNR